MKTKSSNSKTLFTKGKASRQKQEAVVELKPRTKKAETRRKQMESGWESIFDNAMEGIYQSSLEGRYLSANPATARIYGYDSPEELIEQIVDIRSQIYVRVQDRDEFMHLMTENGKVSNFEAQNYRKDGSIIWIRTNARLIKNGKKKSYFEGFIVDITERKRAEETLRQHLAELETLYESGLALSELLEPHMIAQKIIEVLEQKMKWHHVAIRKYEAESGRFEVLAFNQPGIQSEEERLTIEEKFNRLVSHTGQGLSGWAVAHGKTVRVGDLRRDERFADTHPAVASGLYAPMCTADQTIGVIAIESEELNAFREPDERLLTTLATQAAIALENARLFEKIQGELDQRKRAEDKLAASEAKLRAVFAAMQDIVLVIDQEGIYRDIAPTNPILLYSPAEELLGKSLYDVFSREQAGQFMAVTRHVLETNQIEQIEYELLIQGRHLWFSTFITRMDESNSVWVARDITNRKKTEEALRESEERYRGLIELSPDAVAVLDGEKVLFMNPAAAKIEGIEIPDKAIGMPIMDLIHPDSQPRLAKRVRNIIKGWKKTPLIEEKLLRVDGSVVDVEIAAMPLLWNGKPVIQVTFRDITKRKRIEQELKESEQRFRTLIESSPVAITIGQDGKLLYVNPMYVQMHGFASADELIGQPTIERIAPQSRAKVLERSRRRAQGLPTESQYEYVGLRKDGTQFPLIASVAPVNLEGGSANIGFFQDITERKRADEKIHQQLERLTALNAIDQAISSSFDLRISLSILLFRAVHQLKADAMDVLLFNPKLNVLEYFTGRGFHTTDFEKAKVGLGEEGAGRVALNRQMVAIPNLSKAGQAFSRAKSLEGESFIAYYGVPLIAKGKIKGVLEVFNRTALEPDQEWLDFLNTLTGQAAIAIDNYQLFDELQRSNTELRLAYETTIEGWSHALDLRHKETEGHTQRVVEMTLKLADAAGMAGEELVHVRRGALLHDIGKMGIPDSILLKPDQLTDEEQAIMHQHPAFAYDMLSRIDYLRPALDIPYCHHEKWDGTGYPRGLKGEQIPLAARLFAIVDVWDALRSDRSYRKSWPKEKVLEHICSLSGTYFDPSAVELFLGEFGEHN